LISMVSKYPARYRSGSNPLGFGAGYTLPAQSG